MGIASERSLPQSVADDNFQIEPGRLILRIERAAQLRFHFEHRKIGGRDRKQPDSRRLRSSGEIHVTAAERRNIIKNAGALQIVPFRHGHPYVTRAYAGKIVFDGYQLARDAGTAMGAAAWHPPN